MQQKYYLNAFAVSGDITPDIPDAADPNNYVSYLDGFTFDYQRDLVTDSLAKSILRININAIMNDATTNIKNYQENGTPEFIAAAQNGGTAFSYRIYAMVRYSASGTAPFVLYMNMVDNNTNLPTATGSGWFVMPTLPGNQTWAGINTFSGTIFVPTVDPSVNNTQAASTAFVAQAVGSEAATRASVDATKVPLSHMTLSGSGYNSGTGNFSASVSFTPAFNGILFVNGNAGIVSGSISSASITVTGVPTVAHPGNVSGTFGATNNISAANAIYTVTAGTPVTITYAVNSTGTTGSAIGFTYCVIPTS